MEVCWWQLKGQLHRGDFSEALDMDGAPGACVSVAESRNCLVHLLTHGPLWSLHSDEVGNLRMKPSGFSLFQSNPAAVEQG